MTWKTRDGKLPPAQFFADVVGYLVRAYPKAKLDREVMLGLREFLINEWRRGQNGRDAAAATCSCDGLQVVPSPAASVFLAKRSVLPPKQAQRGTPESPPEPFGEAELREPPALSRLRVRHAKLLADFSQLNEALASVTDLAAATRGQPPIREAVERRAQLAQELLRIEERLKELNQIAGLRNPPPVAVPKPKKKKKVVPAPATTPAPARTCCKEAAPTGPTRATPATSKTPKVPKAPKPARAPAAPKVARPPRAAKAKPAAPGVVPTNPLDASEFANLLAAELAADQSSKGN